MGIHLVWKHSLRLECMVFSPYLTFGTPVIQSVLATYILFFKEKKGIKDYVCAAIIFFSAIINARISIIIILGWLFYINYF